MTIRVLKPARWLPLAMALALSVAPLAHAAEAVADPAASPGKATKSKGSRNGLEIYQRFRDHLAEPDCRNASPRWSAHYAHATRRMAASNDELLPLFGYVVDELIKAKLPTEYALIPFIESGYKPAARSKAGPAGLWQFIALTARNQGIPMRTGYDGRYSVVDSTQAASPKTANQTRRTEYTPTLVISTSIAPTGADAETYVVGSQKPSGHIAPLVRKASASTVAPICSNQVSWAPSVATRPPRSAMFSVPVAA